MPVLTPAPEDHKKVPEPDHPLPTEAKLQPLLPPPLPAVVLAQPTLEKVATCYRDYCKLYYSNIMLTNQVCPITKILRSR